MKCAYADPPYLGCAYFYRYHHEEAMTWDDPETHRGLIIRLCDEFPDGWSMSLSSTTLRTILPMCPEDVRIGSWVKPFASFKPNVRVAYAWEPIIFRGGRKLGREVDTVRDWVAENITMERGLTGAKPRGVCRWIFQILGLQPGDEFVDLFPGTGAVMDAWKEWACEPIDMAGTLFE